MFKKSKSVNKSSYGRRLLRKYNEQTAKHLFNVITYIEDQYKTTKFINEYVGKCFDLAIDKLICNLLGSREFYCSKKALPFQPIFKENEGALYCAPDNKKQQLFAFEDFCMNLFAIKYVLIKKLGQSLASKSATNKTINKIIKYLTRFFDFNPCNFKTRDLIRPLRKLIKENNDPDCNYKYLKTIAKNSGYTNIIIKKKLPVIKFSSIRLSNSVPSFNRNATNHSGSNSRSDSNIYKLNKTRKNFLKFKT